MARSIKNGFRRFTFKILGEKAYLKLLNRAFFFFYRTGYLKRKPEYRYHYFAKNLVRPGDTVIDMGANLGYYTGLFSKWVGKNGKVYAVEPVKIFYSVLKWSVRKRKNVILYPYALGTEEKEISMVTPGKFGYLRTGLPHVHDPEKEGPLEAHEFIFTASMKQASKLFGLINKIDFIKCDIEGHEEFVLPEMRDILLQHRPVLQVETWGPHRDTVLGFLKTAGYTAYELFQGQLHKSGPAPRAGNVDYIFIHSADTRVQKWVVPDGIQ